MKRVAHYLILAAVLLGVPYLCCRLGGSAEVLEGLGQFPPRTEDWGFRPEKLWNVRRPFSWPWFLGMAAFTFVCLFPLFRRGLVAVRKTGGRETGDVRRAFPWFGWAGLAIIAVAWALAWTRFAWFRPFQPHTYFPLWLGLILTLNAVAVRRSGRSPLTDRPLVYAMTFPVSSLFWWFFEYLNRYVWNWYYLGVSDMSAVEYLAYGTLCFSTVLPGVMAMAAVLGTFRFFDDLNYEGMARVNVRSPASRVVLALVAATGLCGIVFFPDCAYPLLWISPLTVFVLVQVLLKEPCVLDRLNRGSWGLVFRFEIAALLCGVCWETWNYYSYAKWVYAVPWVHRWQIWEMPVIGFAGYLPFGVECAAVTAWLYDAFRSRDLLGSVPAV